MSSAHTFYEYQEMLKVFRCQDLVSLLSYAGQSKNGKKQELLERCVSLLEKGNVNIQNKIREIFSRLSNTNYSSLLSSASNSSSNSPIGSCSNSNGARYQPTNTPSLLPGVGTSFGNNQFGFPSNNIPPMVTSLHMQIPPPHPYHGLAPMNSMLQNNLVNRNVPNNNFKVSFEKLAFYEHLYEIFPPTRMISVNQNRTLTFWFDFRLTLDQVNQVLDQRKIVEGKYEFTKQIHIRFGYYESSPQSDTLPANLVLNVNSKPALLPTPKPTSKPNADIIRPGRSIDVTSICKLAPNMPNKVEINWTNLDLSKSYCIGVYLYRKISVQSLVDNLVKNCVQDPEITRNMVRQKLQITDTDLEIETNTLKVSLQCPLMKFKIQLPGRSTECKHVQCFDLQSYLMMNEKKPTWNCPVCDRHTPYDKLIICGLFKEILTKVNDCDEILFAPDATWTKIKENVNESKKQAVTTKKDPEEFAICDIDSDEECMNSEINHQKQQPATTATPAIVPTTSKTVSNSNDDIIDLTCDSDEDTMPATTSNNNRVNQSQAAVLPPEAASLSSILSNQTINNIFNHNSIFVKTMRSLSETSTDSNINKNLNINCNNNNNSNSNLQRGLDNFTIINLNCNLVDDYDLNQSCIIID